MGRVAGADEREQLFVGLYERHYGDVLAYLRRRAEESDARDVAAETFLAAWRRLDDAAERGLPWLYRTAALALSNHERTERRQQRTAGRLAALPEVRPAPDPAGEHARRSELLNALRQLPEADRELLLLVTWEQLDVRAAAAATGRTAGATAVRLHRARRKLRRLLTDQPPAQTTPLPEVTR